MGRDAEADDLLRQVTDLLAEKRGPFRALAFAREEPPARRVLGELRPDAGEIEIEKLLGRLEQRVAEIAAVLHFGTRELENHALLLPAADPAHMPVQVDRGDVPNARRGIEQERHREGN